MFAFALGFLAGDLFLQQLTRLPSVLWVGVFMILAASVYLCLRQYRLVAVMLLAFALGFGWSYWAALTILDWHLSHKEESQAQSITGYVVTVPSQSTQQADFMLQPEHTNILIKLYWQSPLQTVYVGDKWRFLVKLKRVHGTQNPGEFDYEAWALQKRLRATGRVLPSRQNQLLAHAYFMHPIDQLRQHLLQRLLRYLPATPTAVWLPALIVGERGHIPAEQWQVLRQTGTNHLMAIAGLHIGIVATIAHFLVTRIWRRYALLCLYQPAQQVGTYAALIVAVLYSALSGFSIPTQRACLMLSLYILLTILRRRSSLWSPWSAALFMVILFNPLSVLTESIWLSFGTIALIIYGMSARLAPQGWWWKWGRVQWVIGVGLIPLSLLFFQQSSLVSFLANSIAIPWLGFLILPFCFLSGIFLSLFEPLGVLFLQIANKSLALLWVILSWFASLPIATWHGAIPNFIVLAITVAAFFVLLLPRGVPGRWLGILWLAPLLLYASPRLPVGAIRMTLLDVGQGLAVVVQTRTHTLVYDAGPKLGEGIDAGESVVVPFLHASSIKRIDKLVISHGDNDHIGGARAMLAALQVNDLQTSVPTELAAYRARLCEAGQHWTWDGVDFRFLYPTSYDLQQGNNSSCVLRIENGDHAILLTGDIEQYAEWQLLARSRQQLSAAILVAPHHGSQTSIVPAFVAAVHPDVVLYAVGYRNRYHFPHRKVLDTYTQMHAQQFDTANSGAITFELLPGMPLQPPHLYRHDHLRYWFDPLD